MSVHLPKDDSGRRALLSFGAMLALAVAAFVAAATSMGALSVFLGGLFLLSGAVELIDAYRLRETPHGLRVGLAGALPCLLGVFFVFQLGLPRDTLFWALGIFFVANGAFRLLVGALDRFTRWGWDEAYGVLAVLMGVWMLIALPEFPVELALAFSGIEIAARGLVVAGRDFAMRREARRVRSGA